MNDIEKKLRKRGMAKLDKFAKNPYKVPKLPWYKRIPLWTKVVIPTAALTTALFVVYFNASPFSNSGKPGQQSQHHETSTPASSYTPVSSKHTPGYSSSPIIPGGQRWEALPLNKKFAKFDYDGNSYQASTGSETVPVYNINLHLDDIVLTAIDDIGVDRSIDAGVFSIKSTPTEQYLALRFSNNETYFLYVRTY